MLATNFAELIPVERLLSRCPIFCPVATSFQLCWRKARGDKLLEWEMGIGKLTRPDVSTNQPAPTPNFCILRWKKRTQLERSSKNNTTGFQWKCCQERSRRYLSKVIGGGRPSPSARWRHRICKTLREVAATVTEHTPVSTAIHPTTSASSDMGKARGTETIALLAGQIRLSQKTAY